MSEAYSITNINGDLYVAYPDGRLYSPFGDEGNCTLSVCPVVLSVYGYRPELAASISLIALYSICAIVQIALGIRYKTWGFMAAMLLGCVDEILGYVGRILLWQNPWGETGFIMQIVLITMGPVFFCAAIYVMISKIIIYISPEHSRVNPKWLYWFFINVDTISLILQAVGGAMSSMSNGDSSAGVNIALAGLAFQVATLALFVAVVADYAYRSRSVWINHNLTTHFKVFCSFLGLATLLIWVRCCYRVYELSEGYSQESEALRDEPLFIALESVMVVVAACCLIVAHPGPVFQRQGSSGVSGLGPAAQEKALGEQTVKSTTEPGSESD